MSDSTRSNPPGDRFVVVATLLLLSASILISYFTSRAISLVQAADCPAPSYADLFSGPGICGWGVGLNMTILMPAMTIVLFAFLETAFFVGVSLVMRRRAKTATA